ncbi:hydroxyethylthiazole kinase 1 [Jeotgalicoccus coquinae]|uniref:Hydroxyethylthiazole kinase n=1 Tax=Jeotgalicoccus coquinae TaxID=709509 RepID=A0A6V7RQI5_9STAP|nr:hydroxyethylthiazole kinase [Jeotgalicoccus coquinae]MBB6424059.1 hydroxyethylthiazole kinase [Jeotgalicoccus coquinae]GGE22812.1 hydroxyethylthiazole kinase 1 [Jeotgalicoccus coquinae]CAD2079948.1 Hydroxyethylthiazole kinase [Jeotgalicoccus coquinae]
MIEQLRRERPLVVCVTNDVVKPFTANSLLSLGASPIMSGEKSEAADILKHAGALLLNIGTCTEDKIPLYEEMARCANEYNIPVVLDPVGYGASAFRRNLTDKLLGEYDIALVKGNAGEIHALSGREAVSKGVDSIIEGNTLDIAKDAHEVLNVPVLVTGEMDAYADGKEKMTMHNGHKYLEVITGSGCVLGAITAAFLALENKSDSIADAVSLYNIAAEKAARSATGPGTFAAKLIDEIYNFKTEDYNARRVDVHE